MNRLLEDKVALVTGGGPGIGRASALALANAGARVVVSGRRENEAFETVALIKKNGGQGTFFRADVSKEADVEGLLAQTISTYGRLDVAFNNAGIEGEVESKRTSSLWRTTRLSWIPTFWACCWP